MSGPRRYCGGSAHPPANAPTRSTAATTADAATTANASQPSRFRGLGLDDHRATDSFLQFWWWVLGHLSFLPASSERRSSREELLASAAEDPERIHRVFRAFDHENAFLTGLRTLVDALARPGRD
ncbi:hypothetical protein ACFWYW_44820 [Nonomuraea sp. NPDC059023]|uniref:hypothetical protein n=1 Tax=unclassified Nonomuraea TaxID=2593643 RepID=UPI0036826E3A